MIPLNVIQCALEEMCINFTESGRFPPFATRPYGWRPDPPPELPVLAQPRLAFREIADADLTAVARFLSEGFQRSTWRDWIGIFARLEKHRTPAGFAKYGYLMLSGGEPVGAIIVVSSLLRTQGTAIIRRNLSSWYVAPRYRMLAPLFISRILRDKNVTYLNVSPAPHTLPILQAQGFTRYVDGQFLSLANSFRTHRRCQVIALDDLRDSEADLPEQELLRAHTQCGCIKVWCLTPERAYPFVFRPRMLKRLPCAQLVFCRDIEEYVRFAGPLGRFLARRGRPFIMIDANGRVPGLVGMYLRGIQPKYYKGPAPPRLGDLAYTETALFGI